MFTITNRRLCDSSIDKWKQTMIQSKKADKVSGEAVKRGLDEVIAMKEMF